MDKRDLQELLEHAIDLAHTAGKKILAARSDHVTEKEDGSPLTAADLASHRAIVSGLESLKTGFPTLSEEGNSDQKGCLSGQNYWLIDPLDGTKEFIKGNGEYTVNIALVENNRPVLGVIHPPEQGWTCYASRGGGAHRLSGRDSLESLPRTRNESHPPTGAISRSHPSPRTRELLAGWGIERVLRRGSSLKFCIVADGAADVYPRPNPTCLWDTATGTIIAREAGCRVVDMNGDDLLHDPAGGIKHSGFVVYRPRRDVDLAMPARPQ